MKMKGDSSVMNLPINMLGWVAIITIFAVIMMFILGFLVQFQTVPTESVAKPTACDVAYMISLWQDATVHPNVFDKKFIESWAQIEAKPQTNVPSTVPAAQPTALATQEDTANLIFEKYSQDFFMPDSDIFLEITSKDKVYKMYLPPESASAFEECAQPTYTTTQPVPGWTIWDLARTGDYFEAKSQFEKYQKSMTTYNAILAECQLPAYMADGDTIEPVQVKAGLTSNLATRLRDGIYQVGVKGEPSVYYPLGSYPEGCIVNGGAVKVEGNTYIKQAESWSDQLKGFFNNLFAGVPGMASGFIEENKVYAKCGFNWGWSRYCQITCKSAATSDTCKDKQGKDIAGCTQISCDGNVMTCPSEKLTSPKDSTSPYICNSPECTTTDMGINRLAVYKTSPSALDAFGGPLSIIETEVQSALNYCPLETRIPNYIAEESDLKDKLCTPKEASSTVWFPKEDFSNYQYFLKVENARSSWSEKDKKTFCENRCKDASPWWLGADVADCNTVCEYLSDSSGNYNCNNIESRWLCETIGTNGQRKTNPSPCIPNSFSGPSVYTCQVAQDLIHLYRKLPEDAINIRYITVSSDKFNGPNGKSFTDLGEQDYASTDSACSTWKSLCDISKDGKCCNSAQDCNGLDCIDDGAGNACEKCSDDYWGFCSPAYLDYPVSLSVDVDENIAKTGILENKNPTENGLFTCQNVYNQVYPSNMRMKKCLPVLMVSAYKVAASNVKANNPDPKLDTQLISTVISLGTSQKASEEIKEMSIDCKANPDTTVRWEIDATGLCCPTTTTETSGGSTIEACNNPPPYCLNMKFWPNLNSGNTVQLIPAQDFYGGQKLITKENYIFDIVQQVCRGGKPYNNADVAFITANYPVKGKTLQYSLEGSEIKLS